MTTLAHLVGRACGRAEARKVVQDLCALLSVAPIDAAVLQRAMVLPLDDFDDAVTAAAAEAAGCEAILTRDVSGFADSPVPGVEPQLWLALFEEGARDSSESELHEPREQCFPRGKVGARRRRPG